MGNGLWIAFIGWFLENAASAQVQQQVVGTRGDEVVGLVTVHQITAVPRDRWPTSTVADAMTPIARVKRIKPTTGLWEAMTEMGHDGVNQLPVTEDGRILGMLTRADVISYLRTLQELGH